MSIKKPVIPLHPGENIEDVERTLKIIAKNKELFKRETKEVLKFIQKNKEYIEGVYGAPKDWILDGGRHKIAAARLTTDKPFELLTEELFPGYTLEGLFENTNT